MRYICLVQNRAKTDTSYIIRPFSSKYAYQLWEKTEWWYKWWCSEAGTTLKRTYTIWITKDTGTKYCKLPTSETKATLWAKQRTFDLEAFKKIFHTAPHNGRNTSAWADRHHIIKLDGYPRRWDDL